MYTIRTCILKFWDNVSVIVVHCTHTHIILLWYTCPTVSAICYPTTCLSELTETLGKQPLPRNVWWIRVNTCLDGILQSGKRLWYSTTAARELPLQKPYTKCMSQYSMWENTKGILATQYTKHSLRNHSVYLEGYAGIYISGERQQN